MTDTVKRTKSGMEGSPEGTRDVPVYVPSTDIYETPDALVLLLEMPGVDANSIDITLDKRELTIVGRYRFAAPEGYGLVHGEYRDGDYERAFTLSDAIDVGSIEASMKDGVLRLTLPKQKPAPAKSISVKVG